MLTEISFYGFPKGFAETTYSRSGGLARVYELHINEKARKL